MVLATLTEPPVTGYTKAPSSGQLDIEEFNAAGRGQGRGGEPRGVGEADGAPGRGAPGRAGAPGSE